MEEEGVHTPSYINRIRAGIINLCIFSADAKHADRNESWSIVIYEQGVAREMKS